MDGAPLGPYCLRVEYKHEKQYWAAQEQQQQQQRRGSSGGGSGGPPPGRSGSIPPRGSERCALWGEMPRLQ